MAVSRIDILNHTFTRALRGYNADEVDALLQEVAETLGRMSEERTLFANRVAQLESQLAEYRDREATLRDTLMTTQRMTDSLKANAQQEAELIVQAAATRAETILAQAHSRLVQIQESIHESKKIKTQFDIKIKALIESHLKMLEMSAAEDQSFEAAALKLKQK